MSDNESLAEGNEIICDEIRLRRKGALETEYVHELTDGFAQIDILDMKKHLDKIVHDFKEKETLPDVVAEFVERKKLNIMVVDLYDFDKGFSVSFRKYGDDKEIYHGEYSYAVSLIQYIRDGEIPYEVFDHLSRYKEFKIFYDGYVICQIRIHFAQENSLRSHFVLLKHTIQTIDAECSMKCKDDIKLNFEQERARLIKHYSPDLCLDLDPAVAEIVISNELNQHPFMTNKLKHIIQNEKARREKGVEGLEKPKPQESATRNLKSDNLENWNFRSKDPEPEEVALAKSGSTLEYKDPLPSYLKERRICFPGKDSGSGFVEIENFVYEYIGKKRKKYIKDVLCISILDGKEFYYGAYQFNVQKQMKRSKPCYWWEIGDRKLLDIYVIAITKEEKRLALGGVKISHCRLFDERYEYSDGKTSIISQKLEVPICQEVQNCSLSFDENVDKN